MKLNEQKDTIIAAAYELFVENGYDTTSVDKIIAKVGIAKGTFYYYFKTKEELLEAVIGRIIKQGETKALEISKNDLPLQQKLVGAVVAMRPSADEKDLAEILNDPKNIVMHEKINREIIKTATPILVKIVEDGIKEELFNCTNIKERVRLLLIMSSEMFDDGDYTENNVEVFIDTLEKMLGAEKDSMKFIRKLIK